MPIDTLPGMQMDWAGTQVKRDHVASVTHATGRCRARSEVSTDGVTSGTGRCGGFLAGTHPQCRVGVRLFYRDQADVRLARHVAAEPFEVALDDWTPLLQAGRGQADGELAVEPQSVTWQLAMPEAELLKIFLRIWVTWIKADCLSVGGFSLPV